MIHKFLFIFIFCKLKYNNMKINLSSITMSEIGEFNMSYGR